MVNFVSQAFQKLPSLHHIDLARNALKPLQGFEFSAAKALTTLILAGNENVVAPNVAVVQSFKLKTLNLSNCSISDLSDNTFQNLSTLMALYLDDNPLNAVCDWQLIAQLIYIWRMSLTNYFCFVIGHQCKCVQVFEEFAHIEHAENRSYGYGKIMPKTRESGYSAFNGGIIWFELFSTNIWITI